MFFLVSWGRCRTPRSGRQPNCRAVGAGAVQNLTQYSAFATFHSGTQWVGKIENPACAISLLFPFSSLFPISLSGVGVRVSGFGSGVLPSLFFLRQDIPQRAGGFGCKSENQKEKNNMSTFHMPNSQLERKLISDIGRAKGHSYILVCAAFLLSKMRSDY